MTLRQQQAAVFCGTMVVIFGLLGAGIWLITQRLTTETTLQTALLMARQVEIALADSLRERSIVVQPRQPRQSSSSFWSFLGNLLPGRTADPPPAGPRRYTPSRHADVKGLMQAFLDRSASIEAMWVVNADGRLLYGSVESDQVPASEVVLEKLRGGDTIVNSKRQGNTDYYDVWVPLQMPAGVRGPGGLRLLLNPSDWKGLAAGLWRQFVLLFALGGIVALLSAFLTTALYTRRFRLISDTLRQAETGTYAARPRYAGHDEVGASLDLIDRLVMKQRNTTGAGTPVQRLAIAARTLAHEVKTPLNALAIHLEVLRNKIAVSAADPDPPSRRSLSALDASLRQIDRLIHDFTDYSAPVTMEKKPIDVAEVLNTSLETVASTCLAKKINLSKDLAPGPWRIHGDASRLRQSFENLLRNAMEAQPDGGEIHISTSKNSHELIVDISDAGPGVPPERRSELFEFGRTTKAGGSGIGLPLSQLIVESHGGSLVYRERNGSGNGATFRVTLPIEVMP
jgi:signal transduction histidine kinase